MLGIISFCVTATTCLASAGTGGTHDGCTSSTLPDSCSDQTSLLQHRMQFTPRSHSNARNAHEMTVGTCIRPAGKNLVEYQSIALLDPASVGDYLLPHAIYEFDAGPWLGMYNPSIVELPTSMKQGTAKFAMTLRRDLHQCQGLVKRTRSERSAIPSSFNNESGKFLLLDANYCVLQVSSLTVSGPVQRLAQDVRLFVVRDKMYASSVIWQFDPTRIEGKGLWLAPVKMHHAPFHASFDFSQAVRLGSLEEKNYGLFQHESKIMALTWLDGFGQRPPIILGPNSMNLKHRTPDEKIRWHNSANLLQLQDGSGDLLGMMHKHMDSQDESNEVLPAYGYGYKQKFFKLSGKPPYVMKAIGPEFCIRNAGGSCESVQFVMSMMQTSSDEILVSYGVNDCESRLASFSLAALMHQMSSLPEDKQTMEVAVMQVPEVQPWLMELSELVSASPLWPYYSVNRSVECVDLFLDCENHLTAVESDLEAKDAAYKAGLQLQNDLPDTDRYESCPSVAGPYGDWPVCNDWLPSAQMPSKMKTTGCVVYDFGIANQWEFSDSMAAQHGCQVHAFDPSDAHLKEHRAHRQEGVTFHFLGLSSGSNKSSAAPWSDTLNGYGSVIGPLERLDVIMSSLGHNAIDVLKIDCEGCEWESLAGVVDAAPTALACVHVMLIELHLAKRFNGNNISLVNAAKVSQNFHSMGWKTWFAVQRGWGSDESEEALVDWKNVGGDSCCYNVGLVNPHFDANKCSSAKA